MHTHNNVHVRCCVFVMFMLDVHALCNRYIPLGIILKSEQKHDEMIQILEHLQKYVPVQSRKEAVFDPGQSAMVDVHFDTFHHIALGKFVWKCLSTCIPQCLYFMHMVSYMLYPISIRWRSTHCCKDKKQ